jgi:hypothetical protein
MNLGENPTLSEVRAVLASVDDSAGNHMMWVDWNGEVHLDRLDANQAPADFTEEHRDSVKFRFETWCTGNDYCGAHAANEESWVATVYEDLVDAWAEDRRGLLDY